MSKTYVRIEAGAIRPGDRVARARSHPFAQVTGISLGAKAIRLHMQDGGTARPLQTAKWWKETDNQDDAKRA